MAAGPLKAVDLVAEGGAFSESQQETLRRTAAAENYNRWLLERGLPYVGQSVLDVGAGIGTFTELLSVDRTVVALEPDETFHPSLAGRFEANPNVSLMTCALEDLELEAAFDSIICFNVLEHIPHDRAAVERFWRLLKPNGVLLLLVPAHPVLYGPMDAELHHVRRYRRADLRDLLREASFAPLELRYVNPVGAIGWFVAGRILGRKLLPGGPLRVFDRLVPLLRHLDRVPSPIGLSVWALSRRS